MRIKSLLKAILCSVSCFIFSFCTLQENGDNIKSSFPEPQVKKQTELLSIVFRLAGNREYNFDHFKLYTNKIKEHFTPYRSHDAITAARDLVISNYISYDAVMSLAINLDDNLNLIEGVTLDERWNDADIDDFLVKLRKFRIESQFDNFYMENMSLYAEAISRFMPVYKKVDVSWYEKFYGGDATQDFIIILSMSNGPCCYGPQTKDPETGRIQAISILGCWLTDDDGMAVFNESDYLPTLIHEFNHSFVNQLNRKHIDLFSESGERIFSVVKDVMTARAYPQPEIVLNEALVRAAVVKYMKDHNETDDRLLREIINQKLSDFYWITELFYELNSYDKQRDIYPDLDSYMPQLASAYSKFAEYVENYDNIRPKVVSVDEIGNDNNLVSKNLKTLTFNFDRPLLGRGYSFNGGNKGDKAMPEITNVEYLNDNRSVKVSVKLESDYEYNLNLMGRSFCTADGDPIHSYCINFRTDK